MAALSKNCIRFYLFIAWTVFVAAVCRCTIPNRVDGGGGTETVIGRVVSADGAPTSKARVELFPSDYNPLAPDSLEYDAKTITDDSGAYIFKDVPTGTYTLQVTHHAGGTKALNTGILVSEGSSPRAIDTVHIPGRITVDLSGDFDRVSGYVYIPGTSLAVSLSASGQSVTLDSVAAGVVPTICYGSKNAIGHRPIRYRVEVLPGSTSTVYNPQWLFARRIRLNTAASGAGVSGTVEHFPVLVRLTKDNFNFSEACVRGADLRFWKSDDTPMRHTIERWDSASRVAEMWVNVDTVNGNDSTQSIMMYWGNAGVCDGATVTKVFDTAAGLRGVWHLGDLVDATVNGYNGAVNGNLRQAPGAIGFARSFDGAGDYAEMGNVCNPDLSDFTVCAWIKPSATKTYRSILTKSIGDLPSTSYGWLFELGADGALAVFMATDTGTWGGPHTFGMASKVFITDTGAWRHVAAVIDRSGNKNCKLFIDGSEIAAVSVFGDITTIGPIVNSSPLRIGADAKGGSPWKGSIDECSIAVKALLPDWIRLWYMNQKAKDALVQW